MTALGEWKAVIPCIQVLVAVTAVIIAAWVISWLLPRRRPVARERLWQAALVGVLASSLVPAMSCYAPEGTPALALRCLEQAVRPHAATSAARASAASETATAAIEEAPDAVSLPEAIIADPLAASAVVGQPDAPAGPAPTTASSQTEYSSSALVLGVIGLVWISGVLLSILRGIRGGRICRQILVKSVPFEESRFADELLTVRRALAMHEGPPIVVSAEIGSPLVIGVMRPHIVLPADGLSWLSSSQLVQILLHEAAHAVRRDALVKLLQNLASGLFWPHPLVHWLNGRLSQAREDVCDNFVLAQCEAADYADTLLQMTERCPRRPLLSGGLAMLAERGSLEKRIAGLLDATRDLSIRWSLWRSCGLQSALLVIPVMLGLIRVTTRPAQGEEAAQAAAAQPAELGQVPNDAAPKGRGQMPYVLDSSSFDAALRAAPDEAARLTIYAERWRAVQRAVAHFSVGGGSLPGTAFHVSMTHWQQRGNWPKNTETFEGDLTKALVRSKKPVVRLDGNDEATEGKKDTIPAKTPATATEPEKTGTNAPLAVLFSRGSIFSKTLIVIQGDCLEDVELDWGSIHVYGDVAARITVKGQAEVIVGGSIKPKGEVNTNGIVKIFVAGDLEGSLRNAGSSYIWLHGDHRGELTTGKPATVVHVMGNCIGTIKPEGQPGFLGQRGLFSLEVDGFASEKTIEGIASLPFTRFHASIGWSDQEPGLYPHIDRPPANLKGEPIEMGRRNASWVVHRQTDAVVLPTTSRSP